jgi:uncharacterized membrane protein YfcA
VLIGDDKTQSFVTSLGNFGFHNMGHLLLFALAGFAASLVDGALGMGFGPTSSSILLVAGLAPTAVSASVNLAKVVTGLVAGISHWRFHNLDRVLVLRLAVPGCIGALVGVTVLSNINGATLRPYLAMLLTIIGLRILVRFARPLARTEKATAPIVGSLKRELLYDRRGVKVAAFVGGVTNGMIGAWGPVVTPFLLHRGVRPRYAIGCVNTAEIAVASTSAVSLIASLGTAGVNGTMLLAMLLGGAVAAPVAAWVIRYVPPGPMGVAVAGLLLITNARELIAWAGLARGPAVWAVYLGIIAIVVVALLKALGRIGHREAVGDRTESQPVGAPSS